MTYRSSGEPLSSLGTVTLDAVDVSDDAWACDPDEGWVDIKLPGPPETIQRQTGTVVFVMNAPE